MEEKIKFKDLSLALKVAVISAYIFIACGAYVFLVGFLQGFINGLA